MALAQWESSVRSYPLDVPGNLAGSWGELRVSAWAITAILFACVFGAALLGMLLCAALPEHHLDDRSKDVVRIGMGLVATMAALVMGLLVASAKGSYDTQRSGLDQISANITLLDTTLAQFGPEARNARDLLRHAVSLALARIWPQDASQTSTVAPLSAAEGRNLYGKIQELSPGNDKQRELRSQALQIALDVGRERWLLAAEEESSSIPVPFLVVVIFWLAVLFASFGLFAPPNATVIVTLFVCALSVSGAIFLILELAEPFGGLIQVSSAPLREAFAHLGR